MKNHFFTFSGSKSRKLYTLHSIAYFFVGILFMGLIHGLTYCTDEYDFLSVTVPETDQTTDVKAINKAAKEIQDILLIGNVDDFNAIVSNETKSLGTARFRHLTTDELIRFGEAFKTRKLVTATNCFAEFSYEMNNLEYSLTLECDSMGNWSILRY